MDNLLFLFSFWLLRKYMLYYGRQNNKTLMYHWTIHAKVMLLEKQIFYPVPNALSLISNLTILRFVWKKKIFNPVSNALSLINNLTILWFVWELFFNYCSLPRYGYLYLQSRSGYHYVQSANCIRQGLVAFSNSPCLIIVWLYTIGKLLEAGTCYL